MKKMIRILVVMLLAVSASFAFSQASATKPSKELSVVVFKANIHCEKCVKKVVENISFEKGVKDLEVSLEEKTVKIVYDPSKTDEKKLKAAIEKLGYKSEKIEN